MKHRRWLAAACVVLIGTPFLSLATEVTGGVLPVGADGTPLNLDFEQGTLRDWKATGKALEGQPLKGDLVHKRRKEMSSRHAGEYWVGTYEVHGDPARGTLTSAPFRVTHPFAAFLVGAGPYNNTCVELVRQDNKEVIFKTSGYDGETFRKANDATEDMHPVVVDLRPHAGQEIFVRVMDQQDGHWAHINFDDFKFYPAKPFGALAESGHRKGIASEVPPMDTVRFDRLEPEEAAKAMTLPDGFSATLFAGEPDIKQPIAFALDDRGRIWVAEAYNYPAKAPEGQGKDRILIFEDTDGDGRFNDRKVFVENLNLVSGLEIGFGGVWVGAAPHFMFIPDQNGDDTPDGPPQILLDGWGWQDTHETLNTFLWGPDGWLYGCHGVFTHSKVGKPGTPDDQRTRLNAAVWRYHPVRHSFEVFAEGTSNPWGIDFDSHGQCFIEACVIPHLFHIIQGARYQRQGGQHFNTHTYEDLKTIGDHVHWAGSGGPHAGNTRSDAAGGGHAHAGLLIYQGDAWPERFHGKIFMNNIHGQRINMDILERRGSGFVGKHGPDFILFNDRSSQVLNLLSDQDGSVYMIDWYDANQCHHGRMDGHDRSNGRIFKIVYNQAKGSAVNVATASDADLLNQVFHPNEWRSRHARRQLQERAAAKRLDPVIRGQLRGLLGLAELDFKGPAWMASARTVPGQMRLLWALHVTGGVEEANVLHLLGRKEEPVRAWTIQLAMEAARPSAIVLESFARMAKEDSSPLVRLYLASACQRLSVEQRLPLLEGLVAHAEDASDPNLPLMYWYAAEPVAAQGAAKAVALLGKTKIPQVREFITRRMTVAAK